MARSLFQKPRGTSFRPQVETFDEDDRQWRRPERRGIPFVEGYRAIWRSDYGLVHKLNLTALRVLLGVALLALAAGAGTVVALAIQFIFIS